MPLKVYQASRKLQLDIIKGFDTVKGKCKDCIAKKWSIKIDHFNIVENAECLSK